MDGMVIRQLRMQWARYCPPLQPRNWPPYHHRQRVCFQQAKAALETARQQVADFLGCNPDEVVFTSGGSESANYAIRGVCSL